MITFLVVSTLVCHSVPALPKPAAKNTTIIKPSAAAILKQRFLTKHFRELAQ